MAAIAGLEALVTGRARWKSYSDSKYVTDAFNQALDRRLAEDELAGPLPVNRR